MIILKQCDSNVLFCVNESVLLYKEETSSDVILKIPELGNQVSTKHPVQENENRAISTACYSQNGEYIAVSAGKQVFVYKKDLHLIRTFTLQRAASKIRFTIDKNILVADKTGDAYLCTMNSDTSLLLGHLSMLLDILQTDCGKYIVTCDRDEKIRVSCYPNSYNIMSYCLGHKEFVTNIEIIDKYLVSASGDGTIRFWNYLSGEQVHITNTNEYIKDKDLIDNFCKEMDLEKCEVASLPIIDMQVFKTNFDSAYIGVSLHNYTNIQIYAAKIVNDIECTFHYNVDTHSVPLSFSLSNNLYVLTRDNLLSFYLKDGQFIEKRSQDLANFYNKYKNLFKEDDVNISVLYKRKFDNVQEYLERKKQRLEGK